jgi:hypothetical protein
VLFKMVRQQQTIPQVLVIPQISGGASYFVSQPLLIQGGESAGATGPLSLPESGKPLGEKPVNPVFDGPRRVPVKPCGFVWASSLENVENDMKPMKVSPFSAARDFILNGRDKGLRIWNKNPFHWEHPLYRFAPSISQWRNMRKYLWRDI